MVHMQEHFLYIDPNVFILCLCDFHLLCSWVRNISFASNLLPGFVFGPRVQFELWDSDDVPVPRKELLQKVRGADGLLCVLTEKIDAELLDAAGLRIVFELVRNL